MSLDNVNFAAETARLAQRSVVMCQISELSQRRIRHSDRSILGFCGLLFKLRSNDSRNSRKYLDGEIYREESKMSDKEDTGDRKAN